MRLLTLISLICHTWLLSACGEGSGDSSSPSATQQLPLPQSVQHKINTDSSNVAATISIDDGTAQPMTIAGDAATFEASELTAGIHSVVVTFYQTWGSDRIVLAQSTTNIEILAGQTTSLTGSSLIYNTAFDEDQDAVENVDDDDIDGDGLTDDAEIGFGTNPFNTDSDNDNIADADEIAVSISGRGDHTCIVLASGALRCWGYNADGQLGNGETTNRSVPVAVSGITDGVITDAVQISASFYHNCALRKSGQVICWGENSFGQLGDGGVVSSSTPILAQNITNPLMIQTGFTTTCALTSDGLTQCWGEDATPNLFENGIDAEQLAVGAYHSCFLRSPGTVSCVGVNATGQLGNGSTTPADSLVSVLNISTATDVAVGESHSCAVLQSGAIECWGANTQMQLGNGDSAPSSSPVAVVGISDAHKLSLGAFHSCALHTTGAVSCWGDNQFGQLGNATLINSGSPVSVSGVIDAIAISSGEDHSCAVLRSGHVVCWGRNNVGQLGNGTTADSNVPVSVSGF